MTHIRNTFAASVLLLASAVVGSGCATAKAAKTLDEEQQQVGAHLQTFDDLDNNVFSRQKWSELHRSHSGDITVHWPDGHTTKGIDKHIEDLKAMFVWASDTRTKEHTVKLGQVSGRR